jgi:hypothetical protein
MADGEPRYGGVNAIRTAVLLGLFVTAALLSARLYRTVDSGALRATPGETVAGEREGPPAACPGGVWRWQLA